jgi:hypothetical protein
MSKIFEYNSRYYKLSNKALSVFDVYTVEETNIGINLLCKYLEDIITNQSKGKLFIENVIYESPIIEFSKLNSTFKTQLLDKVLLDITKSKCNIYSKESCINKLTDFIES